MYARKAARREVRAPIAGYRVARQVQVGEQVRVRERVHDDASPPKRGVAVAAIAADAGNLDRALIELDVVGLIVRRRWN